MIQQIGFKNFRRFENFPMMDLSKVNLLVGTNNSGKSTLVKGAILLLDNLKKMDNFTYYNGESYAPIITPSFEFDSSLNHDLHIGTFKNALYAGATKDVITFMMKIDGMLVEVDVHGDKNSDETTGSVIRFRLYSEEKGLDIKLDFIEHTMSLNVTAIETNKDEIELLKTEQANVMKQIISIRKLLSTSIKPIEIADYNQELKVLQNTQRKLNTKIKELEKEGTTNTKLSDKTPIHFSSSENSIYGIIKSTAYNASKTIGAKKVSDKENIFQSSLIGEFNDKIRRFVNSFVNSIKCTKIEYIYAHAVSQKHILYEHDKNDFLAQTVHQFKKLKVQKGDPPLELKLNMIYALTAINAYIKSNVDVEEETNNVWVFIEEPEQNLHPDFQSKLTEEFKNLGEVGICCMIETHSEYIIRKSQVLVAEENYQNEKDLNDNNSFSVTYFDTNDKEEPYYKMEYEITGGFKRPFGPGFFDVTPDLDMKIIQKEMDVADKINSTNDINGLLSIIK